MLLIAAMLILTVAFCMNASAEIHIRKRFLLLVTLMERGLMKFPRLVRSKELLDIIVVLCVIKISIRIKSKLILS